jgi:hypothetical protein
LFSRNIEGGIVYETQLLGPQYIEEMESDFIKEEIRERILEMKKQQSHRI